MAIYHLVVSDLHSGSAFALIPPHVLQRPYSNKPKNWTERKFEAFNAARETSSQLWHSYMSIVRKLPPVNYIYVLGDTVEGGRCSELIMQNTDSQTDVSIATLMPIVKRCPRAKWYGVSGTPRHVTTDDNRELDDETYDKLSYECNVAGVESHVLFGEFGGLVWRLSHFVGRSGTPYGKQTPVSKELIANTLKTAMHVEHDADVVLFGHTHYCVSSGFPMSKKRGYTCPALKARGESYGRKFNDFYDVGLLMFKQEREGAPLQEFPFKIPVAYKMPKLYRG